MTNKRISVSQLSEYLTASPGRRKTIREDATDPKPFIVQIYNEASSAITKDLQDAAKGCAAIHEEIAKLTKRLERPLKDWERQNVKLCIEAMESYMALKPTLALDQWQILPGNPGNGSMSIGGLRVNVRPEAILHRKHGNEDQIGGLKFYFAKTKPLGKKRADYIGTSLAWYCEEHLSKHGAADYRCSFVVDVPAQAMHTAPKAKINHRRDIEAACEEIAALWPD